MCGATESSFSREWMRASSSRLPPQRTLVTGPVTPDRDAVGGEAADAAGGEVSEHLVAAFVPAATTAVAWIWSMSWRGGRPGARRVGGELVVLRDMHGRDAVCAQLAAALGRPARLERLAEVARQGQRLKRELSSPRLHEHQDAHHGHPDIAHHLDDRGRRVGPVAEHLGLLALRRAAPPGAAARAARPAAPARAARPASSARAASPAPTGSAAG